MPVADLSQMAAKSRTQQAPERDKPPDEPELPKIVEAEVAFLVYRTPEGSTVITPDLSTLVTVRRDPTTHEVIGMCMNAIDDVRLMGSGPVIAEAVVGRIAQAQQAQMAQMQEMALRQQMAQEARKGAGR